VTPLLALLLAGCFGRCAPDYTRVAGRCQLVVFHVEPGPPLTESEFWEEYEDELCDAMEECACEDDTGDCEPEIDCPRVQWPTDCTFDGEAARDCARGRFSCDQDGNGFEIEPPSACERVYTCEEDTGER
jgi:hypothetical protein